MLLIPSHYEYYIAVLVIYPQQPVVLSSHHTPEIKCVTKETPWVNPTHLSWCSVCSLQDIKLCSVHWLG